MSLAPADLRVLQCVPGGGLAGTQFILGWRNDSDLGLLAVGEDSPAWEEERW